MSRIPGKKPNMVTVYAVKTIFNTDHENMPVPDSVDFDDLPVVYHGPFESLEAAKDWMYNVYPDGDTDVEDQFYGEFVVDERWLNDPNSLFTDLSKK